MLASVGELYGPMSSDRTRPSHQHARAMMETIDVLSSTPPVDEKSRTQIELSTASRRADVSARGSGRICSIVENLIVQRQADGA